LAILYLITIHVQENVVFTCMKNLKKKKTFNNIKNMS